MATFLLKTEPTEFSFAHLLAKGPAGVPWNGVSNNTALIHLRAMKRGDLLLIYHTCDQRAIVGTARVTGLPTQDPTRPGLTPQGLPKFAVVPIVALAAATTPLSLTQMKADPDFATFTLLKQPRLSVMPVPETLAAKILRALDGPLPKTHPK